MTRSIRSLLVSAFFLCCMQPAAMAHHSVAGFFDANTQVEIAGVISRVRWRNPHTVFIVDVTNDDGSVTKWEIESGALGVLSYRGLAREFVQAGDNVKILGDKSLRGRPEMFVRNKFEENDERRVIHLDDTPAPGKLSRMGFYSGRWQDENTLVVETSGIAPERLDNLGTPFSDEISLLETFTVAEDGNRLKYYVRVSDPNTFTEPFEEARFWEWRPEIVVGAYICEQDQSLQ